MIIIDDAHSYKGEVVDNGHCVRFLQEAGNVPHTSHWKRGDKVTEDTPPGACIATFSNAGRYENRTDGFSHAAILLEYTPEGLRVMDQWQGHPVAERLIRFKGGNEGTPNNDGDYYHVIET